jgi:CheY-like chemotaxis protein
MAKILIVDDDRDVRESVAKVLERAGHEVALADSGAAGLQTLDALSADLIITDVIMPGQNGVEFIRQLRDTGCTTPIVAISGGGNLAPDGYVPGAITTTAYLAAAGKFGANATLTKPFDRRQLLDIVNSTLAG